MKKLFLIIATLTLLLSHSSTLVSAADPSYNCIFDSTTDTCRNTSSCPGRYLPIDETTEFEACVNKCSSFPTSSNFLLYCKSQFSTSPPGVSCQSPASCVPSSTACYQGSAATCTGDRFCCVQKNPPPTSQNLDCQNQGGQCRLQSYGCFTPDEKGVTSQQCRALSSSTYSYMCCIPNPAASIPPGSSPPPIDPGGYNSLASSQCVGQALAAYMNAVIAGAGNIPNVKLLSPAFNMTSSTFDDIVNSIGAAGGNFDGLDGITGNAYNVANRRVTSWLTEKLKNTYVSGKPFYLTETGEKDFADGKIGIDEAIARLKPELDALRTFGNPWNAQAALLFNGLGTNSNFPTFQWSVDNLKVLCGGSNCGTVGINQASFFSQSDTIYSIMRDLSMLFDLEIATSGNTDAVIRAVNNLPNGNVIVRVGVGDDSGGFSDPQKYVDFIKQVAGQTSKTVYFIAGPNEPDSEFWADPQCKTNSLPAKKGPLEEGFNPQNPSLGCDKTKDPEYNPLRPYPGNPCDPLIPRSGPEAPITSEKKFNTFACGASLTPQREEVFDPYGNNGYYEGLPGPEGYAHTVCDPVPDKVKKNGGLVTCWRSSAFDVTVDLSHANLGVLSNTQDTTLTDAQKVNEYLSWYLTGTPQIGDQIPLNKDNPVDINRLINFAGPLRKLLPFDLATTLKNVVVESRQQDVHNTIVGCNDALGTSAKSCSDPAVFKKRLDAFDPNKGTPVYVKNSDWWAQLFQNIPLSSLEDTAGEYTMSVFRDPANDQQIEGLGDQVYSSVVKKNTAPLQLLIKSANLAK